MTNSGENIRLQLSVNGKIVATSGIDLFGVVSAMVVWVRRDPAKFQSRPKPNSTGSLDEWKGNDVRVSMSGLNSQLQKHLRWFDRYMAVGDEVKIRVLPPGDVDAPNPARRKRGAKRKPKARKPSKARRLE